MGNGNNRRASAQGIGVSAALGAIAVINTLFVGGQIDCGDPSKDYIEVITSDAEIDENGVQVVICIVDGKGLYDIEVIDDEKDLLFKEEADTGFEVKNTFENFKITTNGGEIVTQFKKGIEISVLYSKEALEDIYAQGYQTPRVALMALEEGEKVSDWEEIGGTVIKEFGPEELSDHDYELVMVFKLWALPDPRIGGC